jgi:hypothetical protein
MFWLVIFKLFLTSGILYLLVVAIDSCFFEDGNTILEVITGLCCLVFCSCLLLYIGKFIYCLWF